MADKRLNFYGCVYIDLVELYAAYPDGTIQRFTNAADLEAQMLASTGVTISVADLITAGTETLVNPIQIAHRRS